MITSPPNYPILTDPSWRSTWAHRALVACGSIMVLISLAKAIMGAAKLHLWFEPILVGLVGHVLADLMTGVYHWGIDNYGSASTPIFGSQIDGFQRHHKWPWTITRIEFASLSQVVAPAVTFTVLPMVLASNDPILHAFVAVCSGCIMLSLKIHAWAHTTKSQIPPLVIALQDMRLLVSPSKHANHHRPPYNNNYCMVSGVWNELLDKHQVFKALEMILFSKLGWRPRSWSETSSNWTEDTESQGLFNPSTIQAMD
ncbi:hypothetical protein SO802_014632 [Lithocarpus litseifolius]|uniref:Lipid desaturase domain-containing protein n=1 Tax=Lithocarpus litseifolius TaxID=425828 RepID=A0AAW2CRN9_9ROSI